MKRIILFLSVLFFVCKMNAQSMLEGNPVWTYYEYIWEYDKGADWFFGKYYLSGTIDIDGRTYQKVYLDTYHNEELQESKYQVGLREENGRIYVNLEEFKRINQEDGLRYCRYELTGDGEVILYDFNLKEGDVRHFYRNFVQIDEAYDVVKSRQKVKMNDGSMRDMLQLTCIYRGEKDDESFEILCGIGSVDYFGGLLTYRSIYAVPNGEYYLAKSHLNLFFQNGRLVYRAPDDGSEVYQTYKDDPFFPETVGMSRDIIFDNVTDDAAIYDLSGRRLSSFPERGIYIRGGKKFWVR